MMNEVLVVVVVVVVADGIELCDSSVVLVDASPPSPTKSGFKQFSERKWLYKLQLLVPSLD